MTPLTELSLVVDLNILGDACRPVVAWFDDLHAGRTPDVHLLDRAIQDLRRLPPVGGRLGRAIDVVAAGGSTALDETLAAIELLRHAACRPHPIESPPTRPPRRTTAPRRYDTPLPGFGADELP